MLQLDDIKYIKRLYKCEEGKITNLVKKTGYSYKTIRKYLDKKDFNEKPKAKKQRASLLDPLTPIIDKWLEKDLYAPRKQRHTAIRVYQRLQKEYPNELKVKSRTVQTYVSKKKQELKEKLGKNISKGYIPLYHPPGEAQVDFGHFSYYNNAREMIDALKLTVSFPFSNNSYCQIFKGENQECLLQGLKNIFEYLGVVPYRMVFDNLSAAVASMGKGHNRTMTDGFKRFMMHYDIEPVFCNGAAGWEKGNVENKVGYERRNMFVPVPTILDFELFNKKLFKICEKDAKRVHYFKKKPIIELFEEDKASMIPINEIPFNVNSLVSRIADKYAKVTFKNNLYSSSPKYAKETVYVKATSDTVTILNKDYKVIETHPRLYGNGLESMKWLPYLELLSRRPMAFKYTKFYDELPDNWRKYINNQDYEGKRKALHTLHAMLSEHGMQTAESALDFAVANGVNDLDSIFNSYRVLTTDEKQLQPMKLKKSVLKMPVFKLNNNKYDSLLMIQEVTHEK